MTGTLKNSKKKNGGPVCWEHQQKHATKHKQLDKCLNQSDSCLYIICRILLTSNHMIFLEQFGINKTPNCTHPTGLCSFASLWKIYSKLHSVITYINRIVFDTVCLLFTRHRSRPLAKPGRLENAAKSGAFSKRYGFIWRVNSETALRWARLLFWLEIFIVQFKMVNLACSAALAYTITTLIFWRKRFLVNTSNRIDFDAVMKSCCHVDVKPMLIHKGHAAN